MAVRYLPIDGESVSAEWHAVLMDMRRDVAFNVNEGHRTMARQWYFWNGWRKRKKGFNLAAFPSPWAPHIRTGRIDHAIDFSNDGAVFSWLQRHGYRPVRTVRGESWHVEVPITELQGRAANPDPLKGLGPRRKFAARRLLHHRREAVKQAKSGKGPRYRSQVKWRGYWRRRVVRLHRRARGRQRWLLGRVLSGRIR